MGVGVCCVVGACEDEKKSRASCEAGTEYTEDYGRCKLKENCCTPLVCEERVNDL